MDNLSYFAGLFHTDGYDILISPNDGTVLYRGVVDKNWLRISPQLISSMYGGQSEAPWTMVGMVTHIQGTYVVQEQMPIANTTITPMMLDAYRNMFRSARVFERMFLESDNLTEIVVSPLAIYRSFVINRE